MADEEKFDAIVVGAGPAGSAAAYAMAREGLSVLVIERGPAAGAKNMVGGRMYSYALHKLIPEFWNEAPVERHVVKEIITMLTPDSAVSLDLKSTKFAGDTFHSFTVLRAEFDNWLATKAEEAGAMLACGVRVDDLLWEGNRVVGVRAGGDDMLAEVVIAADGVNAQLARKAGLTKPVNPNHYATGVKEIIELSPETIANRFNLAGNEGAAQLFVGECTKGIQGGGFLYTNKNSISLGLVFSLGSAMEHGLKLADLVEEFKQHPAVAPLIAGGKVVEYSAHMIPEGGMEMMPQVFTDGMLVVGDAAGLCLNIGYAVRGMDLAILSGMAAAQAVCDAKAKGDFSKATLSRYQTLLKDSVLKDMETFRKMPHFMETVPRLFTAYPRLAEAILLDMFTFNGTAAKSPLRIAFQQSKQHVGLINLMKDGWKGVRTLL